MNALRQALNAARNKYGKPAVCHVKRPTGQSFLSLSFGDEEIYFMPSYDNFTIYEMRKDSRDIVTHTWRDLGTRSNQVDVMARLVEVRPRCRALAVVTTCTALVVAGHWHRLTVLDMIHQATDAEYSMLIRERASTYSMVGGLV